jgi:hypothetical protein
VTRVVRVVKPVEVRRVVRFRNVSQPVVAVAPARVPSPVTPKKQTAKPKRQAKPTPIARTVTPVTAPPPAQTGTTGPPASDVQTSG